MSKARLVITAVILEGRSQREVARAYGVSQGWISRLVARFRREGEAAFEARSRRPLHSPTAIPSETLALVLHLPCDRASRGLDAGPETIAWHLAHGHHLRVSPATISRYLTRHGLVVPTSPPLAPPPGYPRRRVPHPAQGHALDQPPARPPPPSTT